MPLRSRGFVRTLGVDYFYNLDVRIVSITGIGCAHEFTSRCSRSLRCWPRLAWRVAFLGVFFAFRRVTADGHHHSLLIVVYLSKKSS